MSFLLLLCAHVRLTRVDKDTGSLRVVGWLFYLSGLQNAEQDTKFQFFYIMCITDVILSLQGVRM